MQDSDWGWNILSSHRRSFASGKFAPTHILHRLYRQSTPHFSSHTVCTCFQVLPWQWHSVYQLLKTSAFYLFDGLWFLISICMLLCLCLDSEWASGRVGNRKTFLCHCTNYILQKKHNPQTKTDFILAKGIKISSCSSLNVLACLLACLLCSFKLLYLRSTHGLTPTLAALCFISWVKLRYKIWKWNKF